METILKNKKYGKGYYIALYIAKKTIKNIS